MKRIRTLYWINAVLSVIVLSSCSSQEIDALASSESDIPSNVVSDDDVDEADATNSKKDQHTNRLSREISPYLLLHAHNPVDWYPWGPEAFEKAKREGKLIFISIGYSSCYWCHVMERKVFSDEKIAAYMNKHFVNIKIDREERPDIDDIYMTALNIYFQLIGSGQGGGWPLSMFVTPEGKPVAGGTYIPPKDEGGRLGFPAVMKNVFQVWTEQRDSVEQNANVLTQHVRRVMKPQFALNPIKIEPSLVNSVGQSLLKSYDPVHGGVDFDESNPSRPKFPVPTKLALLQSLIRSQQDEQAAKAVYHTLDRIASGGIYDHLAGGFHRYSTDRSWLVPHFEKMLYDNAQLMDVFVEAYRQTRKPLYREVVEAIADYVFNEMTDARGGFYSALDAETDTIEGKFYVWTHAEVEEILGQQSAKLFKSVFGMHEPEVFEHGYILHVPKPLDQVAVDQKLSLPTLKAQLRAHRKKMLVARNKRKRPFRDDKILTSWNGLMIRALANAGRVLDHDDYIAAAEKAAQFILTNMRDPQGRLLRTYRSEQAKLNAYLDDYSFLIEGLLAVYEATGKDEWLNASRRLTDDQIELFWDSKDDGFFFTSHHHEELLARTKNAYDSVLPSGNSVSVRNLVRLASISKQTKYRTYARKILELFALKLKQQPRAMSNMALAMAEFLDSSTADAAREKESASAAKPVDETIIPISGESTAEDDRKQKNERITAKAYLSVDKLPAGRTCRIVVHLHIKPGWHINANPAKPDFLVPTTVKVSSKQGTKLTNVRYPAGTKLRVEDFNEPVHVYEELAVIYGTLEVPNMTAGNREEIEVGIRFQPCNASQCLRPQTTKLTAKLIMARKAEPIKQINQRLFKGLGEKPKVSAAKK